MVFNRKGITLLELILVLALVSLTIPVIYSIFFAGNSSYNISKNRGFAQQDVRLASDFIATNLMYVTALSDDENEFYTDYYSLKVIQKDEHDVLALIHNVRDDKGTDTLEDDIINENIIKQISGSWDNIAITYIAGESIVNSLVSKTEGKGKTSSRYTLPIETHMINSEKLLTSVSAELYAGEAVYFRDAKNKISQKSIYITDSNEVEDEGTVTVNSYDRNVLYRSDYVSKGNTITLTGIEDDLFKGWSKNQDLSGEIHIKGSTLTIFEDTNLYAVWEVEAAEPEVVVSKVEMLYYGVYKSPNVSNNRLNIDKNIGSYTTHLRITGVNLKDVQFDLKAEGITSNSLDHSVNLNTDSEIIIDIKFSYGKGSNDIKLIIDINDSKFNFYYSTKK